MGILKAPRAKRRFYVPAVIWAAAIAASWWMYARCEQLPNGPFLLARHAFWCVVLIPPAALLAWQLPCQRRRVVGSAITTLGALWLTVNALWNAREWLAVVSSLKRSFYVSDYVSAAAILLDVPVAQLLAAGLIVLMLAKFRE